MRSLQHIYDSVQTSTRYVPYTQAAEFRNRCTGKSTEQAFRILALCYAHKNRWIPVRDHDGIHQSDRMLMDMIADMVGKLEFGEFQFRGSDFKIRLVFHKME